MGAGCAARPAQAATALPPALAAMSLSAPHNAAPTRPPVAAMETRNMAQLPPSTALTIAQAVVPLTPSVPMSQLIPAKPSANPIASMA
jgi:hypothetical protein